MGVTIGLVASLRASRRLAASLLAVGAHDPSTFIAVAAMLLCVAMATSFIPALRAAVVNPLEALRSA